MRILHVTRELAGDRRYGLGRSLLPVTQSLQAAGHHVRYLTQEDLGLRGRRNNARLRDWLARRAAPQFGEQGREIASPWAERIRVGHLAARLACMDAYDVVHLHDPWLAWGYVHAMRAHRAPGAAGHRVRWGFTEHGYGSYADATHEEGVRYTSALMNFARQHEAQLAAAADWVCCPTAAGRRQLARDLACPVAPPHWHVVPHPRPQVVLPSREAARSTLGLPTDVPLVLAIGRINPVKRLERIVQACAFMNRPLALTLLAGTGDATPLLAMAARAPRLRLDVRQVDDVAPWLAAADVYVSASVNESFGMANLEALVAGLPSVCTGVGGVPEVMGNAAWLVPPGDAGLDDALAGAIATLLDDPARRHALAAAARQRGTGWPAASAIGERYEAIYRGVA